MQNSKNQLQSIAVISETLEYQNLEKVLEGLVKSYRKLLDIVRKEKDLLLEAKVDELVLNNQEKEEALEKISALDSKRINSAVALARLIKLESAAPRLLEIAEVLKGTKESDQLRQYQNTLALLFERLKNQNLQNETFAKSALKTVNGALDEVKETLSGKKTYQKGGQYKAGPEQAGNFVSKEA
ncbi:MAG: flagellar protein FlgN [Pseudobdellovibrionaceae bacterium]